MADMLEALAREIRAMAGRHNNRPFLRAAMASCALVDHADGAINSSERVHLDAILDTLEELKTFDLQDGVEMFVNFVDELRTDTETGHQRALDAIKPFARDRHARKLLMDICGAIAVADGPAHPEEVLAMDAVSRIPELPSGRRISCIACGHPIEPRDEAAGKSGMNVDKMPTAGSPPPNTPLAGYSTYPSWKEK